MACTILYHNVVYTKKEANLLNQEPPEYQLLTNSYFVSLFIHSFCHHTNRYYKFQLVQLTYQPTLMF